MSPASLPPCHDAARMPSVHADPLILTRLLDQLGGHDAAPLETAEWLLRDPALTARLLLDQPDALALASPEALLERLDSEYLKHWLVPAAVAALVRMPAAHALRDWQASLSCALLCRDLAMHLGYPDARAAYLAGLLHNLDRYADAGEAVPGCRRAAGLLGDGAPAAVLAQALLAQDEDAGRLAEALPLGRVLRVARALVHGENAAFRLAATLLPELAPDNLDGLRRQVEATVAELGLALAPRNDDRSPQARLHGALDDYFRIEHLRAELAPARTEAEALAAALPELEAQLRLRLPAYLALDRAANALVPAPGSRHPGLRIRLPGSNSAAAWAMSSREPVVFATLDTESVSLLDVQLARLSGVDAVVAIPVGEGKPEGVLIGCVDLDQAARLEQASAYLGRIGRLLGRALAQARSTPAGTESELDQFKAKARRAAHEINNPLGIVRNYLAILDVRLAELGQRSDELAIIREEIDRIPGLLQGLTGDERGPAARRDECDIAALVRDLAKMAESAIPAGKQVRIAARIAANLPVIRTDAGKLRQLLLNLVLNALDACPEEGLVGLDAYASIDLTGAQQVLIAVRDNGGGIAPDKLARLYEPSGSDKGGRHAGLGLAIVKTLATELGLAVNCRSDGQGTTFQIAMPSV